MERLALTSNHPIRWLQRLWLPKTGAKPLRMEGPGVAAGIKQFYLQKLSFNRTFPRGKWWILVGFILNLTGVLCHRGTWKLLHLNRTLFRLATEQHPHSELLDNEEKCP